MTAQSEKTDKPAGVMETIKTGKEIYEIAAWVISIGVGIRSVIQAQGGIVPILTQVAAYGIACYLAIWVILPLVVLGLSGLEKAFGRETNDTATAIIAGIAVLGGGAFFQSVFAPEAFTDLDFIGTTFVVLLGSAILLIPVVLWWYLHGSNPKST